MNGVLARFLGLSFKIRRNEHGENRTSRGGRMKSRDIRRKVSLTDFEFRSTAGSRHPVDKSETD